MSKRIADYLFLILKCSREHPIDLHFKNKNVLFFQFYFTFYVIAVLILVLLLSFVIVYSKYIRIVVYTQQRQQRRRRFIQLLFFSILKIKQQVTAYTWSFVKPTQQQQQHDNVIKVTTTTMTQHRITEE